MKAHAARKHSKYSASGAERWITCPGSVALSEGVPDKETKWSVEGTRAHEVLEKFLRIEIGGNDGADVEEFAEVASGLPKEMVSHSSAAANFILDLWEKLPKSEILVETRVILDFIHPEMFGTFDGAVIDHFGTLHVFDFKYGAGHAVSPVENLQMIFYGIGLAHQYDWNFKRVRLWIIQPRIKGYDGPTFWEMGIMELKGYVKMFRDGVERVKARPNEYVEGGHCHWCKAKSKCPLKQQGKLEKAMAAFSANPLTKREKYG